MSLLLPAGINDASTRALAQLIDERFSALPVERVLVWHLAATEVDVVAHIAEMLGLDGPGFGGDTPLGLIRRGVMLCRRHGTPWALREVLRALGYGEVEIVEEFNPKFDGEFYFDGARMYGADAEPGIFWLACSIGESKSADWVRALWDVIDRRKRRSAWQVLIVRRAADGVELARFHSRAECAAVGV